MRAERRKRLIGAGPLAQAGQRPAGNAPVLRQMTPVDVVPLSAATGTGAVRAEPSPDGMDNPVPALVTDRPGVSGTYRRHARL